MMDNRIKLDGARTAVGVRFPLPDEWEAELAAGWPGPDGSSNSTDTIFGVRIGATTKDYKPTLPANEHDFWYRVLRRLQIVTSMSAREVDVLRKRADVRFRERLLSLAPLAPFGFRTLYRVRCWIRYRAVRRFGGLVNRPDIGEERFFPPARG